MKVLVAHSWRGSRHIFRPEIELFKGLKEKGVEIHLLGEYENPIIKEFLNSGFKVFNFSFRSKYEPEKIKEVIKILNQEQYDIVHAIHNKSVANMIRALKGRPEKLIAYRGASINWTDPTNYLTFLNPRVDTIICLSKTVEKNVQNNLKFWRTPTIQIYKGQELDWFCNVENFDFRELQIPENAFTVVLASSVRRVKGVEYFIKAMNHLPQDIPIHFVLAGHKTDHSTMVQLKQASKAPERIHLLGHREDVLSIMKSADCFVLPTIGIEGLSRSVMEAMLLGTPVISTKCGGPEELIQNKLTGLLIEKKQPKAIAEAILKLYKQPDLRETIGNLAKENIVQNFNVQQSIKKTYNLYQDILKG